ncbi:MAG: T9SS type A sorting domain-containing protein [Bacteroidales bacterium]|nr:T9SS type A sorting domain-containing protein [Bacteroidales bacterium]
MQKRFFLVAILIAFLGCVCAQTPQKVLFIGNSYVYTNDLPLMLKTLAQGCGHELEYSQSTPGGCFFQQHLNNPSTTNLIAAGGWDHVILQEQSQTPAFPIGQVQSQCFPYAQQLCEKIRQITPDANIVFYMTWGRKIGDATNCPNYPPLCTYEGMDSLLYERYMMMAEQNHTAVSPVGRVWRVLRTQHPEIELYNSDESHPSQAGTYAAAVTFYTILFRQSPTCITNDMSVNAAAAQAIRQTVENVVYDSLDYWYQYAENQPNAIDEQPLPARVTVAPNPAGDVVEVLISAETSVNGSVEVYDVFGRLIASETLVNGSVQINSSNWKPGVYFVKVTADGKVIPTQKLIKE